MDLSKLQLLNTDTLQKMQAEIDRVLKSRLDTRLFGGRTGHFTCSAGIERHVLIDRVNAKSVSVTELADSHRPGTKWRVSRGMLRVTPVEIKAPAVSRTPAAPPRSYAGAAW